MDNIFDISTIISESSLLETYNLDNFNENTILKEIDECLSNIDELSDNIFYNEEMIPIIQIRNDYLVEYSNLIPLMRTHKERHGIYDEKFSLKKLSEHYNIPMDKIILVLENKETYDKTLAVLTTKMRFEKNPLKKNIIRAQIQNIKNKISKLRGQGIKMVKKATPKDIIKKDEE